MKMYSALRYAAGISVLGGGALFGLRASLGEERFSSLVQRSKSGVSAPLFPEEVLPSDNYDAANVNVRILKSEDKVEEEQDDYDDVNLSVRMLQTNVTASPITGTNDAPAGRLQGKMNLALKASAGTTAATLSNDAQFVAAVDKALTDSITNVHSVDIDAITNAASRRLFNSDGPVTVEELRRQLQTALSVQVDYTASFTTLAAAEAAKVEVASGAATTFSDAVLAVLKTELTALGKGYEATGVETLGATLQSVTAAQAVDVTTTTTLPPNPDPVTTPAPAAAPTAASTTSDSSRMHSGALYALLATAAAMLASLF